MFRILSALILVIVITLFASALIRADSLPLDRVEDCSDYGGTRLSLRFGTTAADYTHEIVNLEPGESADIAGDRWTLSASGTRLSSDTGRALTVYRCTARDSSIYCPHGFASATTCKPVPPPITASACPWYTTTGPNGQVNYFGGGKASDPGGCYKPAGGTRTSKPPHIPSNIN